MPIIINSDNTIDNSTSPFSFISKVTSVKEDEVDTQLDKLDGRIQRQFDPRVYEIILSSY